ncbi:MAG: hypothetical protein JHC98_10820 [Thermoleophilaceae bacterium]|nr:hypothetical protein [Thermoleophilaceae bacterium]
MNRAIAFAFVLALALAALLTAGSSANAKKVTSSASAGKAPKITKVTPIKNVMIGTKLSLKGKNFVKGKKTLVVIFRRDGSKRSFTARGDASSSTRGVVVVPDVSGDLVRSNQTTEGPLDNLFRLRPITKFGAAKAWTGTSISPRIVAQSGTSVPTNVGPTGDCDKDAIKNSVDLDDDGDLLEDTIELSIGTDVCNPDTDGDDASDFYEYTVAFAYNGGPTLPYPSLRPYPNPLLGDSGNDFDGDFLTTHGEYRAWQYTGKMSRFYSDADQDSDDDGKSDGAEDEDGDLLPNLTELTSFSDLNWLKTDSDGDQLCDGLDDQDHDGPATPLALADCTARVPNNGPAPAFPPTDPADTVPGGDPDAGRIDGDDNRYSNFYEWYLGGAEADSAGDAYNVCAPSIYPVSPFCSLGAPWNPLPVPDL